MSRLCATGVAFAAMLCLAAPLTAQDPWSRVPAFPTACYDKGETGFSANVTKLRLELGAESEKQSEINSAIKQRLVDMDMSTQQSNMMAFMMKDPAKAGARMQENALAGQKQQKHLERLSSATTALAAQLKAAEALYAADKAPGDAFYGEWRKEVDKPGFGDAARARQLLASYDTAYEKLCAKWLVSKSSPLLEYLASYKNFLLTEQLPLDEEMAKHEKFSFEVNGIPHAAFKPIGIYKAVVDYLSQVSTVFGRLNEQPRAGR